ncbi:hypothetical protein DEI99_000255 [Curtobacterium sp. MCLR17_036]|uniref:hypothetical protein n=1 Tax=Curtobacterium sp. MCLR17_036 TaxID=2175620 RepID=UPI000DA83555|nr:hypothetical protein [Curtobacterium sp. MCLR17_036]WIE64993.1 hypothetical protein DEI99_000255 [Curtobacterium sp. MCLR17_036]
MRTKTEAALRARHRGVQARIAAHPLNDPEMERARMLVKNSDGAAQQQVSAELRAQGLPSMTRQTWTLVTGLPGLARLNRRRLRLERELRAARH